MTVKDLPTEQHGQFLWCPVCDSRYSANVGDYFWMSETDVFECCGEENVLVRERIIFEYVGGPGHGEWEMRS